MEFEKCYEFTPADGRPAKRRRLEAHGLHRSWPNRKQLFQEAWSAKQTLINDGIAVLNEQVVHDVCQHLDSAYDNDTRTNIPAAIVLTGPRASNSALVQQVMSRSSGAKDRVVVRMSPAAGSNLKTLLKYVIRKATSLQTNHDDEDEEQLLPRSKQRLLSYDLQALQIFAEDGNLRQVLVVLDDVEGFNGDVLSELICQFAYWRDRIPFVLLMTVATSVDILQQHLLNEAKRVIKGRQFLGPSAEEELGVVIDACLGGDGVITIGASLMRMLIARHSDYILDIGSLISSIKYAYMCSFFANPLSVFLSSNLPRKPPKSLQDHIEALRMVPSFQSTAQGMLGQGQTNLVRELIESDQQMYDYAIRRITEGRQALDALGKSLSVIRSIQSNLPSVRVTSKPTLYLQGMSGKLRGSAQLKSLFLSIRKASPDAVKEILQRCVDHLVDDSEHLSCAQELNQALDEVLAKRASQIELPSKIAKKQVSSVNGKPEKTDPRAADCAKLVRQFADDLESYLNRSLIVPKDLPFHEIFVYDLMSPLREVFAARPRYAIERALTTPHVYLGCECCEPDADNAENGTLSQTQPMTTILYQLYLESGNLINVHDAWRAFQAIIGEEEDEQQTMALFQRALADLKHLGMVKATRKRVDHVAKVAWKGL